MRIGIDARFLTYPQPGGFKTYSENLISALAEVDAENEYILYLDRPPNGRARLPDQENFTYRIVRGDLQLLGMPWREQIGLPVRTKFDNPDLLHSPSLTAPLRLSCPSVVTIHDMIWFFSRKLSQGMPAPDQRSLMRRYYQTMPEYAARRAAVVITVSQASKESILQNLGIPSERIIVTYEAAGCQFRRFGDLEPINPTLERYHLPHDFILAIGSADPRKNIVTLVEAYSRLSATIREKHHLVIVWTHQLLEEKIVHQVEKSGLVGQVHFVERVPTEDLVILYNACSLFVFPSLFEGFGLPPLEAMSCGAPVIAGANSSIPEIVGDAALLVDAADIEGLASKISLVLCDDDIRKNLIQKGAERAACFSWKKCARETIEAYKQALNA